MSRVLVVFGPNLNLLGEREPHIYGHDTMEAINARLQDLARAEGVEVEFYQSNSEGAIIDRLQQSRKKVEAVVVNAGALSHYSYALRDAIAAIAIPVIEIHMTNVVARGEFRTNLVLAPACKGVIYGFGVNSFLLGLRAAIDLAKSRDQGSGIRDQTAPVPVVQSVAKPEARGPKPVSANESAPLRPEAKARRSRVKRRR
ncbi:MAG: type II 3-dehydroquinate dehydratase [Armatimonadetes bacterium]|nr:type II 3-dehydroquinate dehydratase [Armatimonadota bacterium]